MLNHTYVLVGAVVLAVAVAAPARADQHKPRTYVLKIYPHDSKDTDDVEAARFLKFLQAHLSRDDESQVQLLRASASDRCVAGKATSCDIVTVQFKKPGKRGEVPVHILPGRDDTVDPDHLPDLTPYRCQPAETDPICWETGLRVSAHRLFCHHRALHARPRVECKASEARDKK